MTAEATGAARGTKKHWPEVAYIWEQLGPPLRPSEEDLVFFTKTINSWAARNGSPQALILGVTPELYHLPWPPGTNLLAADNTRSMIDMVWPGPQEAVVFSDWTELPLPAASLNMVLCDGGLHLLAYPQRQQALVHKLYQLLAPGGLCLFRLFVPPPKKEQAGHILENLLHGKIASLNMLKLRLAMALQETATKGIALRDVWNALYRASPDLEKLAASINWPLAHLSAINTYKNSPNRYFFVSVAEVCRLFAGQPGGFSLESVYFPTYPLGERCPTVVFRRKASQVEEKGEHG